VIGNAGDESGGGAGVALKESADLTFDGAAVQSSLGFVNASSKSSQSFLDVKREALVHGLLFLPSFRRAAQDESLVSFLGEFCFDPITHGLPSALVEDLRVPALHFLPGSADHVSPPRLLQPGYVLSAHHPAIHHPDPVRETKPRFHDAHDFLDRGHVHAVAVKNLVGKREAFSCHPGGDRGRPKLGGSLSESPD